MRGPEERKYFYGMLGTILICVFVYIVLMYFHVHTFIRKEYYNKVENVSMQFGNNFEQQLISVEECVTVFSNKYGTGLDNVKLFDAMRALNSSDINIAYVIFKNDKMIYDNAPAGFDLRNRFLEIEEKIDEKSGKWLLDEADRSLIYAVRNEDGSMVAVVAVIDRISDASLNNRYFKNAKIDLSDGANIVTLKEKTGLNRYRRGLECKYKFRNGNLQFNYYLPVPVIKVSMVWLGMAILLFVIVFVIYIVVINNYIKGIFLTVANLEDKMQEYIDSKK